MSRTLLMVGTRKGMWLGTSDEARTSWDWTGPHFPMEEVYSVMVDTRGEHAAPARGRLVELARPAGLALRRPRRDVGRDAQRRRPLPRGHRTPTLARVWQLQPGPRPTAATASSGRAPSRARSSARTDRGETFSLVRGLWDHPHRPEWNEGFGGQAFHTILPHPSDPSRVLAALSTGGVYVTEDGGDVVEARRTPG